MDKGKFENLHSALNAIAHDERFTHGSYDDAIRFILSESATLIDCQRVSAWAYSSTPAPHIVCLSLFDRGTNEFTSGSVLGESDAATYLQSLTKDSVLVIDDVMNDPRCAELVGEYLPSCDIRSMLDAPFQFDGQLGGVLCFEHVGTVRTWTEEEQHFSGSMASLLSIATERYHRRQLDAQLKEEQSRYRLLVDNAPIGIVISVERRIEFANQAIARLLDIDSSDQLVGLPIAMFFPEDRLEQLYSRMDSVLETHRPIGPTEYPVSYMGKTLQLEMMSTYLQWNGRDALQSLIRDVTAQRQAEDELKLAETALRQAHKMEAVGQLTGGIAHDFNNILTIVMGNLELLEDSLRGSPFHDYVRDAIQGTRRGAELTRKLLSFSRTEAPGANVINLNHSILNIMDLLGHSLTKTVAINLNLDDDLWDTTLDPGDLEDAVLNLALNARDAMDKGEGTLTITTFNQVTMSGGTSHERAVLRIEDDGAGMSPQVLERVFDPFFTTKTESEGTGLGLSMVYGFIQRSDGRIEVESTPGKGTAFQLDFPRSGVEPNTASDAADTPRRRTEGKGRVLVVEDEPLVADVSVLILQKLGFDTVMFHSGSEALEFLNSDEPVDLLFTDAILGGSMNGFELAEQARQCRPGLPILLTSGYNTADMHGDTDLGRLLARDQLRKPYDQQALSQAIARVME